MPPDDPLQFLRRVLPLGAFANIEMVYPSGAAASRGAILARAEHLLGRPHRCFIKLMRPADSGVSPDTAQLFDAGHLSRSCDRVERARRVAPPLPLVTIVHNEYVKDPACWLLAMEEVTTIASLLGSPAVTPPPRLGPAVALQVLAVLRPQANQHWTHWDVAPENVGIGSDERVCLLDLDSFFLSDAETPSTPNISVPTHHAQRIPLLLHKQIQDTPDGRVPRPIQTLKCDWELALLAAECETGAAIRPFTQGRYLVPSELREWLDAIGQVQPEAASHWRRPLLRFVEEGVPPDVVSIADTIRARIERNAVRRSPGLSRDSVEGV